MRYQIDGTFQGLLTAVFLGYHDLENSYIEEITQQNYLFEDTMQVETNEAYAERVKKSLIEHFGTQFYRQIQIVFLAAHEERYTAIARVIKKVYLYGNQILKSADTDVVLFESLERKVLHENHKYKGLLRFREVEGNLLVAQFRPEHDIITILAPHFMKRLSNERWMIHDVGRGICLFYENHHADLFEVESLHVQDTEDETLIKEAWKEFYQSVSIKERQNKKLRKSNMPMKYWDFLPEIRNNNFLG